MNKWILGIVLAGFAISPFVKSDATPPQNTRREVVILQSENTYIRLDAGYTLSGIVVCNSSSSDGSPKFPHLVYGDTNSPTIPVAEAIASLITQGYRLEKSEGGTHMLVK